ncbi:MAG: hypothetical protein MJY71_04990 [Bacteroidaceae bacterium]|nr:hypothetical protein [Bacteroidaceae bacterium]
MTKKVLFFAAMALVSSVSFAKKESTQALFGIKSGIITLSQDPNARAEMEEMFANMPAREGRPAGMPGMDSTMTDMFGSWGGDQVIYFDDYGLKQVTVSGSTRTLVDPADGARVTINDEKKTGTKMPSFGGGAGMPGMRNMGGGMASGLTGFTYGNNGKAIDWLHIDEKTLKKNRIKSLGQEEIQGVVCDKYSMKTAQFQTVVENTMWVYKGIVLQTENNSEWGSMGAMQFASIQECEVPAELFEIGSDITISEPNFGGMGGFGGGFGGGDFGGGMGGFGGGMGGGFGGF